MAYNTYFPATYQPMSFYGQQNAYPYQQNAQQMMQAQQQAQAQQPPIQQSAFVLVRSEQEAKTYPVAPGNSVTFKDENAPFCYVKTMGFNSFDRPVFEKYRLVKEEAPADAPESPRKGESKEADNDTPYALKSDLEALRREVDALKAKEHTETEETKDDASN